MTSQSENVKQPRSMIRYGIFALVLVWMIWSFFWGLPLLEADLDARLTEHRIANGHTAEGCANQNGTMQAISTGLFGGGTKTVCLLPSGETFTIASD